MGGIVSRRLTAITGLSLAWVVLLGMSFAPGASAHDAPEGERHRTSHTKSTIGYKAATVRRHGRSAVLYRSGEHKVVQISPSILRRADPQLDDGTRRSCGRARAGRECDGTPFRHADLPEALLQTPSPATEQSLKQLGVPIIRDVYPIVILRPGSPDHDDSLAFERR
jgi:hypothetical protein